MRKEWRFASAAEIYPSTLHTELMNVLHEFGTPEAEYDAAELIFGELISNVIRYASARVTVSLDWTAEFPTLCVADGDRYAPPVIALPADPLAESGRGLFIVNSLAKAFSVDHTPETGSVACATLPVRRRAA
jgi:anti-sigma regulatory factor (Ser/Thr protein kinase)